MIKNIDIALASAAIKTTMIGAIDAIEKKMGYLWAHGNYDNLTNEEQEIYEVFMELRDRILDIGNKQIRKLKDVS